MGDHFTLAETKNTMFWGQMVTGFRVFEPGIMLGGKTANTR